jgi:hypothetical protein
MTPYDPFDTAKAITSVMLQCPRCETWTDLREYYNNELVSHCLSIPRARWKGVRTE